MPPVNIAPATKYCGKIKAPRMERLLHFLTVARPLRAQDQPE